MQKTKYFMYLNAIISSFAVVVAHTITNPVQLGVSTTKISFYLLLCIVLGIIFSYGVPLFLCNLEQMYLITVIDIPHMSFKKGFIK